MKVHTKKILISFAKCIGWIDEIVRLESGGKVLHIFFFLVKYLVKMFYNLILYFFTLQINLGTKYQNYLNTPQMRKMKQYAVKLEMELLFSVFLYQIAGRTALD